ncbi:tRNA (adenosine(37)-N6)-dimethylallyltransferase MiaA [Blattabacterium punctulatus]|uniref:tRNA (adenosine(37)-N6)-dimethylallyltransferase MiaA n=1 Tax=Blattabacterium punctulatus TaxID=164514 RepID=UPI000D7D1B17|nr:tRNA (adenosine(37)-N6)-dimethylallyltransferase MiaA [Blattabacterium punctulatus]AWU44550.1 tRNA (adenosine(37)-N6)-dimethylallyltransferase MiaA [Blattabacterium punctulatus]AWU45637.1 tRNA (adenosine(37)-N6)-dimethylallyltransferase MiaA [Blattabacterium punctulatus]
MKNRFIIFILGPTSIGKTSISIFLAKKLKTEILSCDSRQFYKELKIGTSMPTMEDLKLIPHHFIGHLTIHQIYNAKYFEIESRQKIKKLFHKYSILIMVGGSGLYERAVINGLSDIPNIDLNIRNNLIFNFKKKGILFLQKKVKKYGKIPNYLDINNPRRLIRYLEIFQSTGKPPIFFFKKKYLNNFTVLKIGLILSKDEIYFRINNRVEKMIKNGLLEEAKKYYPYRYLNSLNTIGYKEIYNFFSKKKYSISEISEEIKKNTRKYAKKQLTWYRKDTSITWFNPKEKDKILSFILNKVGNTGFEPVTPCL